MSCFNNTNAYIPIVEQDVWCPHLVSGEAKVFDTWVLRLVPLQIMIIPVLRSIYRERTVSAVLPNAFIQLVCFVRAALIDLIF